MFEWPAPRRGGDGRLPSGDGEGLIDMTEAEKNDAVIKCLHAISDMRGSLSERQHDLQEKEIALERSRQAAQGGFDGMLAVSWPSSDELEAAVQAVKEIEAQIQVTKDRLMELDPVVGRLLR